MTCKREKHHIKKHPFFEKITHAMEAYGYRLHASFFGGGGAYVPQIVRSIQDGNTTPEEDLRCTRTPVRIQISRWLPASVRAHYLMHEMMHFYQDMHGLYFTPRLMTGSEKTVMLDAKSMINVTLFCEAWAEVEAIHAAWQLKENGDDFSWRGAMKSPDWKVLAQHYEAHTKAAKDEEAAARLTFQNWYEGDHVTFYQEQALTQFEWIATQAGQVELRSLSWEDFRARIPQEERFAYLTSEHAEALFEAPLNASQVMERCAAIEHSYGRVAHSDISDMRCGSAVRLYMQSMSV